MLRKIDNIKAQTNTSVEHIMQEKGIPYSLFEESVKVTEQILNKIKSRIPKTTQLYIFSSDDPNPYYEELKK